MFLSLNLNLNLNLLLCALRMPGTVARFVSIAGVQSVIYQR
jgi:hypothetical protein